MIFNKNLLTCLFALKLQLQFVSYRRTQVATPPPNRWKMSDQNVVELPYKTAKSSPMMQGASGSPLASGSYSLATGSLGMDKSTLKVHLPDGSFNVVRFGDATDIKVSCKTNILRQKSSPFLRCSFLS